jgi:hypothetical protein
VSGQAAPKRHNNLEHEEKRGRTLRLIAGMPVNHQSTTFLKALSEGAAPVSAEKWFWSYHQTRSFKNYQL